MLGGHSDARQGLPEMTRNALGAAPAELSGDVVQFAPPEAAIRSGLKLDYGDVLIEPQPSEVSSRNDVEVSARIGFPRAARTEFDGVPVMAANMDGVGTFEMADALRSRRMFTCLAKHYSADELIEYFSAEPSRAGHAAVTIGLRDSDWRRFKTVAARLGGTLRYACLDAANGYVRKFADRVREFRAAYPDIVLIAGNVVTPEQTKLLAEAGADAVKVGIGGGSVCETRLKTGVGYPQFSAVLECAAAARQCGARIVADGGCTGPGDVAKALAAGADFVMLGGMLAGHKEGGGEVVSKRYRTGEVDADGNGLTEIRKFVEFYGMSSKTANERHFGGLKDYRASEGRTVMVPYRESLDETVADLLGGIRSACSYVGASSIGRLPERARFVRCNRTHNTVFI